MAELCRTGQSRHIGADYARKCILILELLDKATLPEYMNVLGLRFHGLQGKRQRRAVRVSADYRIAFRWSRYDESTSIFGSPIFIAKANFRALGACDARPCFFMFSKDGFIYTCVVWKAKIEIPSKLGIPFSENRRAQRRSNHYVEKDVFRRADRRALYWGGGGPAIAAVAGCARPGKTRPGGEYIDIVKQLGEMAQKANSPTGVTAYRGVAGNPFELVFISTAGRYGEFDETAAWIKSMPMDTRTRGTQLLARRNQCVESVRVTYERALADLSIGEAAATPPKMIRMTRVHVRPGMADSFLALMKAELVPAYKKGNVARFRVRRVEFGGSRNDITLSAGIDKMGDLDQDLLQKVMGPDAAKKYLERAAQMVSNSEYLVFRRVADLSYAGKQ